MTTAKTVAMPAPTMAMALPARIDNISKKGGKQKKNNAKANNLTEAAQQQQQCQQEQQQRQLQNNNSPGNKQQDAINEHQGRALGTLCRAMPR